MWKAAEGSTQRLLQLCGAYFFFYVIFGVATKCFTGKTALFTPAMGDMEFLVWSTLGGNAVCLAVIATAGWWRDPRASARRRGPLGLPREFLYIVPSGVCTAVVIPTTTLMYMLLKSVMVAMVIMRASVIVISRLVDELQVRQGILKKRVVWEENVAVLFAVAAAGTQIFLAKSDDFDFLTNTAALIVLCSYISAYAVRIYIMNYYKNTRPPGAPLNNKWFFSIEQVSASVAIAGVTGLLIVAGGQVRPIVAMRQAVSAPHDQWSLAILAGVIYGMVAFFSVFIFMFKGRTATFAGLVNRMTSLVAGTTATLLSHLIFGGRFPSGADWSSLGLVLTAVVFLARAERRRVPELAQTSEATAKGTDANGAG
ncbi:MAG: hypothetical protein IT371_05215 [Deltaproteobacteria bacterium]|nr:hypothetical protein [Deltaproteobacteria bacterium]